MSELTAPSEADVTAEENRQRIAALKRRGALSAVRDYVMFWGGMLIGAPCFVIGGIEYIEPTALDLVQNGRLVAGVGLALVAGPKVVAKAIQIAKALNDV